MTRAGSTDVCAPRPHSRERPGRRRAWLVLAAATLTALCAALATPAALTAFGTGGTVAVGTEAAQARETATRAAAPSPDLLLLVSGREGESVDSPRFRAGERAAVDVMRNGPGVRTVWSLGDTQDPWLRSKDGRSGLIAAELMGSERQQATTAARLVARARDAAPGLRINAAGRAWTTGAVDERVERDMLRAEALAAPAVLLVLLVAYGSLACALLPLAVAVLAVGCAIPVLGALTQVVDVSRFAVNATSAIGFGLAVDYTLFLLARYQEERGRDATGRQAMAAMLRTSGRTVVCSAVTVAGCLGCLLVVPVPLLRALALAGSVVTVLAAVMALTVLPAALILLGPLAERADPLRRVRRARDPGGSPFWRRTAGVVTRRPVLAGAAVSLMLLVLAWPLGHARLGTIDERALPSTDAAALVGEDLRSGFAFPPERLLTVVVTAPSKGLDAYRARLSELRGVTAVRQAPAPTRAPAPAAAAPPAHAGRTPPTAVLVVAHREDPSSVAAAELVRAVRATTSPGPVAVGGRAAEIVDTRAAVRRALPRVAVLVAAVLLLVVGVFTRSVVAPLKTLAVALVTVACGLGVVVSLVQNGRGRGLLGTFTPTGTLDASVLLFTLAVGLVLSVDYEVFLLGRIREEFDRGADNRAAIVEGIARTGRLMTSAALAVAISTAALTTSSVTALKVVGLGIALIALADAVLVRGVLVPAVMTTLGPANWWHPFRR
ncbi:MMPL family transporter [Streptomyces sp. NPDC007325]|uniref:MMPL family transporter n=1 Tax=Streptomyces sp. NPDC007325 TaxID=3154588 RepID=UPI0033C6D2E2